MPKQSSATGQVKEDEISTNSSKGKQSSDGIKLSTISAESISSSNGLEQQPRPEYKVSSHTLRITKHGYAIEPVELRYREILGNLSVSSRKASELTFDPAQTGHQMLSLIRGFWSQPAFPRGRLVARPDKHATIESILQEFKANPLYPHRETRGSMTLERAPNSRGPRTRHRHRSHASRTHHPKQQSPTSEQPVTSPASSSQGFLSMLLPRAISQPAAFSPPSPVSSRDSPPSQTSSQSSSLSNDTYHSWIPANKTPVIDLVNELLQQMERLFAKESRIIKVSSPCTVLGDIHGNLMDLRSYERSLWPKAPVCLTSSYLFLGDYVDRGDYSVECVLYLFAMKLVAPDKFYLLRGNHEVAAIQRQYTFSRECETKFGHRGNNIWRHFNKVFDLMPVAAIIDEQIFCAHGGIPRSMADLKRLAAEIPSPLDNPEVQSPAAWEILWNDPITDSELIGMIEMDNAVVTQTQSTQTQASPDGKDLVTTTTSSTAIASSQQDPASQSKFQDQKQPQTKRSSETLGEADTILTREPAEASTFYVKSEETRGAGLTSDPAVKTEKGISASDSSSTPKTYSPSYRSEKSSNNSNSDSGKTNDNDDTLRRMPSDTSSIASTGAQQIISDGFVANIKRGTAYLFSDQAINNFLRVNNLTHVIRAHEVIPTGFAFHGDGRVITIFSSSKYCGLNNQAACALVQGQRIRILRLDTGEEGE